VTFASVGSAFASTAASFSLTPGAVGDLIVVFAITESTADYASSLSSSNVTWSVLLAHQVIGSTCQTVFLGKVTAASAATVTVTYNAGTPTLRLVGKEFSTTAGFGAVTLDTSGTVNATTTLFPSLSPSRGAGELYAGYAFNAATASAGSTSGYTYYVDANGNGLAYNAACTSGAQQPAWTDNDALSGVAVLLYEAAPSRFPQPGKAVAGKGAARKGAAPGSPGAPRVTRPSPFAQPNRGARGAVPLKPGTAKGSQGAPYVYVAPVVASFAQPGRAVTGRPSARHGTAAGSPGAPRQPRPSPFPQPGAQPGKAPAAHPAARRGIPSGSPGAPYVYVPVVASPFAQPRRAVAGRRAARKGTASASGSGAASPLVQETSGSSTTTSLTLTFPGAVTAGHAVIIAVCGFSGGSVSGITLGGVGSTFTNVASGGGNAQVWADLGAGQASPTIVITATTAGIIAYAYELSGVVFFDTAAANSGTGTSWSSGAAATTVPYPHFTVGIGTTASAGTITPTAAGWANQAARTGVTGAATTGAVSGYRLAPPSGTYTYSGTAGSSAAWGAVTAVFLAVPQGGNTWGGYIFEEHASYTGVTATFTIPSSVPLVTEAICSIWVGLGNIYQTGIFLSSNSSYTGNVDTSPWSWWLGGGGGAGELWSTAAFPTGPGDSLTLTLTVDGTFWYATIANNTRDWTYTEVKSVLGNNAGCWAYDGTTGAPVNWGWIYPVGDAVVVIEQEGGAPNQLPGYGSITFTGVTTTPAITQAPPPQFTVPSATGGITQYPGPFNLAARSFTMTWNQAD